MVISCDGVQIQTTRNSVLIKSSIPTIELCSTTEEIEMTIFEDFFKQIMKLSQKIEHLADFQPNPNCRTERLTEDIGNILNSNLTKRIIGNIKISHIENKMEKLQYIVWYNDNCYFSLNEEFRKIIRNFNRYVTEGKDAKVTRKLMIQNFIDITIKTLVKIVSQVRVYFESQYPADLLTLTHTFFSHVGSFYHITLSPF